MWAKRRPAAAALVAVILLATAAFGVLAYRHFRNLDDYSRDLEAKNLTITKNNSDLEERNKTITQKSNDLVAANTATTRERDRAEDNLLGAVEAIDSLLGESGADKLAHVPHFDRTRRRLARKCPEGVRPLARRPSRQPAPPHASGHDAATGWAYPHAPPALLGSRRSPRSRTCRVSGASSQSRQVQDSGHREDRGIDANLARHASDPDGQTRASGGGTKCRARTSPRVPGRESQ